MQREIKVFLDSSALVSAVYSALGASRLILKLGEIKMVALWVGSRVVGELDSVLERRSPDGKALLALLLDRSGVSISAAPDSGNLALAQDAIGYPPDARVVAEALQAQVDFFVTFDRQHILGNPRTSRLPFLVGTAGDFVSWYRARLLE